MKVPARRRGVFAGSWYSSSQPMHHRKLKLRVAASSQAIYLLLLAVVIFVISAKDIAEPDVWWHMQNARHLLATHSFPSVDTYSFTAGGSPWLDHEWLSEIPLYLGFRAGGLRGLLLVYASVLALIFAAVFYRCLHSGAEAGNAAFITLGAIVLGEVSFGPRTILFGWLCMAVLLILLDRFRETGSGLWWLFPLFALWVNLHGSWVLGMTVITVFILCGLLRGQWGLVETRRWTPAELRSLLLALAGSIVALFVNPFGYKLVLYPFDLIFRQATNLQHVDEWQPVNFQLTYGKLALIAILALLAVALISQRRWLLYETLLSAIALWAALAHIRLLFFLGLVIAPIIGRSLKLFSPVAPASERPLINAVVIACIVAGLVIWYPSETTLQARVDANLPTAALAWMQHHGISGPVFNNYRFGGYMIWKDPEFKTFIDGRADLFVHNGVFDEYVRATQFDRSFEILNKYKIEYALLEPEQPLLYVLRQACWRALYADNTAVLLQRPSHGECEAGE
jgi:hypothetical protein